MYVYILKCADNSLYTGISSNIEKRIRQHLGIIKGGAKYTKSQKPLSLETAIKKLPKSDKTHIISAHELLFIDYFPELAEYEFIYQDTEKINNSIFKKYHRRFFCGDFQYVGADICSSVQGIYGMGFTSVLK